MAWAAMIRDFGDAVREMPDLAAALLPLYLERLNDRRDEDVPNQ